MHGSHFCPSPCFFFILLFKAVFSRDFIDACLFELNVLSCCRSAQLPGLQPPGVAPAAAAHVLLVAPVIRLHHGLQTQPAVSRAPPPLLAPAADAHTVSGCTQRTHTLTSPDVFSHHLSHSSLHKDADFSSSSSSSCALALCRPDRTGPDRRTCDVLLDFEPTRKAAGERRLEAGKWPKSCDKLTLAQLHSSS